MGTSGTAVPAALVFLEANGHNTAGLPSDIIYDAMIQIANHELDRAGLAAIFGSTLG